MTADAPGPVLQYIEDLEMLVRVAVRVARGADDPAFPEPVRRHVRRLADEMEAGVEALVADMEPAGDSSRPVGRRGGPGLQLVDRAGPEPVR